MFAGLGRDELNPFDQWRPPFRDDSHTRSKRDQESKFRRLMVNGTDI
jgi:hypothetical protein